MDMPDESCRTCGGELVNHALCSECRKATQKKCKICENITNRQIHELCAKTSINNDKVSVVEILQNRPQNFRKHQIRSSFIVLGIIGFFVMGFIISSYLNTYQGISDEAQATDSNNAAMKNIANLADGSTKSYDNCLAYGSGESITITCPQVNGGVYKAILEMPKDFAKIFSESVFSIRGISLMENTDGSVTLQYLHKEFRTNFFGN